MIKALLGCLRHNDIRGGNYSINNTIDPRRGGKIQYYFNNKLSRLAEAQPAFDVVSSIITNHNPLPLMPIRFALTKRNHGALLRVQRQGTQDFQRFYIKPSDHVHTDN